MDHSFAIVGLSGRFPGANNISSFWQNLSKGVESISTLENQPNLVPHRGLVDNIDLFDASFFDISPGEAALIDPQQRLFLECSYEALESAGYNPFDFEGKIGVYGGSGDNSYLINNLLQNHQLSQDKQDYLIAIGNRPDFITTRVSYKLNLKGPSLAVQTACSTSLVAVCLACNDLILNNMEKLLRKE
ncbi:MAG: polyketide synthase [Rhabdochlamydiaceae bacterium]|nr:polyketide synthase [Candidatus Amphrikana amoebophyrae]